jgi:hypothetical protein
MFERGSQALKRLTFFGQQQLDRPGGPPGVAFLQVDD